MVTEDVPVGTWTAVGFSGAIPVDKKRAMLERVEALQKAVKFAREAANNTFTEAKAIGDNLFDFILGADSAS